jgi:hypothetical protein
MLMNVNGDESNAAGSTCAEPDQATVRVNRYGAYPRREVDTSS